MTFGKVRVLVDVEQEIINQKPLRNIGKSREITWEQAKDLLNKEIVWSNRMGSYVLSSTPPSIDFLPIQTPPIGAKFLYNRVLNRIFFYMNSQLISMVNILKKGE